MNANFRFEAMDRDSYEKALEEQERLLAERARIDQRLRLLDEFITLHARVFSASETASMPETRGHTEAPQRLRQRNPISPSTVGRYAREMILEAKRPLTRGQLLVLFEERQIPIIGGDKSKVLGTIIWRLKSKDGSPLFVNTGRGYWPADVPVPEQ